MVAPEAVLPTSKHAGHLIVAAEAEGAGGLMDRFVVGQRRGDEQGCDEGAHSSFLSSAATCSALSGMKMRLSATICCPSRLRTNRTNSLSRADSGWPGARLR